MAKDSLALRDLSIVWFGKNGLITSFDGDSFSVKLGRTRFRYVEPTRLTSEISDLRKEVERLVNYQDRYLRIREHPLSLTIAGVTPIKKVPDHDWRVFEFCANICHFDVPILCSPLRLFVRCSICYTLEHGPEWFLKSDFYAYSHTTYCGDITRESLMFLKRGLVEPTWFNGVVPFPLEKLAWSYKGSHDYKRCSVSYDECEQFYQSLLGDLSRIDMTIFKVFNI
jgi:hypothetical protein